MAIKILKSFNISLQNGFSIHKINTLVMPSDYGQNLRAVIMKFLVKNLLDRFVFTSWLIENFFSFTIFRFYILKY